MSNQLQSRNCSPTGKNSGANSEVRSSVFDALPESAFVREAQLIQSPKRPSYPAPLPFSAPTLWRMVNAGKFPKPIKLSARITGWRVSEVRAWLSNCKHTTSAKESA